MRDDPIPPPTRPKQAGYSRVHVISPGSFIGKLLGVIGALLVVLLVFTFSLILLAVVGVVAILIWGYLKYRGGVMRRAEARGDFKFGGGRGRRGSVPADPAAPVAQRQAEDDSPASGLIIEGEAARQDDPADDPKRQP